MRGYPIQSLVHPPFAIIGLCLLSAISFNFVSLESGLRHDHGRGDEVSGIYRHFQVRFGIFNYSVRIPRLLHILRMII